MRKNRKSSSHTHGNRIYIMAFLLAGSFILGGCRIMKEKGAESKQPEIVIGIDYFEPYVLYLYTIVVLYILHSSH